MRKSFNKIICFTVAAVAAAGVITASACSNTFKSVALKGDYSSGTVVKEDNGGFAVKKGNYIYFINGKEANTADNTYGNAVKGAIMRIAKSDFNNRNYSSVETVVPQIAYSGNVNGGIFVYGDRVYYSTPSTEKNSDGEVQNSYLAFKSTKLDGTESMKGYYAQYSDNTIEYRYVEEKGTVYLLYVATDEKLFGEASGKRNLHSVNTETGADTLLAYDVESVIFDKNDLTNPRVYYTMKVYDYELNTSSKYNQIYTVTASANRTYVTGAQDFTQYLEKNVQDDDGYQPDKDPKYVNCGTLVLDGIGFSLTAGVGSSEKLSVTPFNGADAATVERNSVTYALSGYEHGNLFYTVTNNSFGSSGTAALFDTKENEILSESWNPVKSNPADDKCLVADASAASSYVYMFDNNGDITNVFIPNSTGLIKTVVENGKIVTDVNAQDNTGTAYYMTTNGQPSILLTDYTNKYIYYSVSQNANGYAVNGYSVNRIRYDGNYTDYGQVPFPGTVDEYSSVCVLDLDAVTDWYKPEMYDGTLLFLSQTENMSEYGYVMACNLNDRQGNLLNNEGIKALNEKYDGVFEKINETDASVYENLQNAYKYAFYKDDVSYIDELIKAYVDIMKYDEERFYSKESVEKYKNFVSVTGDWAGYAEDTVNVNNAKKAANKHDYYYSVLGLMNEADAEAYDELLKTNYLQEYPEKEQSWFEGLSKGAKAGFIIGVVAGGLLVIAAAVVVALVIVRKRKEKLPTYKKQRIKVDTTDDKNINVYDDEQ